jgi:hypothetical protein
MTKSLVNEAQQPQRLNPKSLLDLISYYSLGVQSYLCLIGIQLHGNQSVGIASLGFSHYGFNQLGFDQLGFGQLGFGQ